MLWEDDMTNGEGLVFFSHVSAGESAASGSRAGLHLTVTGRGVLLKKNAHQIMQVLVLMTMSKGVILLLKSQNR